MSFRPALAPLRSCRPRPLAQAARRAGAPPPPFRPQSTRPPPPPPTRSPRSPRPPRARRWPLALALALPFPFYFLFSQPGSRPLDPQAYSDHACGALDLLSPRHALLAVPLAPAERALFAGRAVRRDGSAPVDGEVVVQHVMVKSPDIQIERPYTPVNDPAADGELRVVVKRVRGGEVGRVVHSLKPGDAVGLRGPITTLSLNPADYDSVVMLSTGTAAAPFLQLLAKADPAAVSTKFTLVHAQPTVGDDIMAPFIERARARWGDRLAVVRPAPGVVDVRAVQAALRGRVMALVCVPPPLMREVCGPLTPALEQGPLTGMLAGLGLRADQVWKLE